jgi:hypothetical protein
VKRDELLANFDAWGSPVKKDLWSFPASFEVLPLIASAMDGVRDVQRLCAEIGLDHALAQSALLVGVLDRIESTGSDGEPAVFRHRRVSETGMTLRRGPSLRKQCEFCSRSPGAIRTETVCGQRPGGGGVGGR